MTVLWSALLFVALMAFYGLGVAAGRRLAANDAVMARNALGLTYRCFRCRFEVTSPSVEFLARVGEAHQNMHAVGDP